MNRNFEVNVNGQSLSRVSSYRYLGIEVDETVNWQSQTDTMVKKISAGLGGRSRFVIMFSARY